MAGTLPVILLLIINQDHDHAIAAGLHARHVPGAARPGALHRQHCAMVSLYVLCSSPEFGEHHNCRQVFPPPRGRLLPVPVGRLRGRRQHVRQQRRVSGHVQGHRPLAACGAETRGTAGGRRPHQHAVSPAPVLGAVRGHADQILLRRGHVSHVGHLKCHTCHIVTRTSCHSK